MFANRFKGLINLHTAAVAIVAVLLFAGYATAVQSVHRWVLLSPDLLLKPYLFCVAIGSVLSVRPLWHIAGRYHRLTWADAARLTTSQAFLIALCLFTFMFAIKDVTMSRLFIGTYIVLAWMVLFLVNRRLPKVLSDLAFEHQRKLPTLLIGGRKSVAKMDDWLASCEFLGFQPVAVISNEDDGDRESRFPWAGSTDQLERIVDEHRVAQVIALETPKSAEEGRHLIEVCKAKGCRLLIYSNLADLLGHPLVTVAEQGHQFYALQSEPLEDPLNRVLKRAVDVAIALPIVVIVLPPLMLWVGWMQRRQAPGRMFFTQERSGYGRRAFRIFKFRTMSDEARNPEEEAQQARRDDDRVYPFGGFLRRTSLDEVPQFFNVLRGDMSIVGPRPHMLAHDERFSGMMEAYRTRFFARPGITGLAQCRGLRGEISDPQMLQQRITFDIDYVSNWSIWLDVQLMLKTVWIVLFPPRTAY